MKILLFDDIDGNRAKANAAIKKALDSRGEVCDFVPETGGLKTGTHEERLLADLKSGPNSGADLIVADRDLSGYGPYAGLSEPTVKRVAEVLGIPECGYARGEHGDEYVHRGDLRDACIRLTLKPDMDAFAGRVVAIAEGFLAINAKLEQLKSAGRQPPGKLLAAIIDKPEYADKIGLYSSGDQSRMQTLARIEGSEADKRRRLSCLLGYWLWDSVLRYPGVTVGEIPASSYLDIHEDQFKTDPSVLELFASARYKGPFADAKIPMWWRGMLDDILAEANVDSGRIFAASKLKKEIARSRCCEHPEIPAGYYCILKEKPVSLAHSKGGLPWLPRGADLTRVSTGAMEELGPWL